MKIVSKTVARLVFNTHSDGGDPAFSVNLPISNAGVRQYAVVTGVRMLFDSSVPAVYDGNQIADLFITPVAFTQPVGEHNTIDNISKLEPASVWYGVAQSSLKAVDNMSVGALVFQYYKDGFDNLLCTSNDGMSLDFKVWSVSNIVVDVHAVVEFDLVTLSPAEAQAYLERKACAC